MQLTNNDVPKTGGILNTSSGIEDVFWLSSPSYIRSSILLLHFHPYLVTYLSHPQPSHQQHGP